MQYKPETEKVAMVAGPYIPVVRSLPLTEDREVQRTRKILMIILGVFLALCVGGLVTAIFESGFEYQTGNTRRSAQVGQTIIGILFYGFGLFVAHRYSAIGLRVFGWIGIIVLIFGGIGTAALIFIGIVAASAVNDVDSDTKALFIAASMVGFIVVLAYIAMFVILVIIVKFAFKLARVIDANKRLTIQGI